MKKIGILFSFILTAFVLLIWYSCQEDPAETCKKDEICETKYVTACCDENECVYKYDGKEYSESEINDLAVDLGCSVSVAGLKSENNDEDLSQVIEQLKKLMEKARK